MTVVTCVYCGHEYPSGTPTSQNELLTAHIQQCAKHPMSRLASDYVKVRSALIGLIGCETREELEAMEAAIRRLPAPAADKAASIDAIHALLQTPDAPIREPD